MDVVNPQLADLSDMAEWAGRIIARSQLPILLRRLVLATAGVDLIRAPGGDAVGEHGWDIRLETPEGFAPWIPQGSSRWEGGVGKNPRTKAQSDFKKRTDETPADVRALQTFVFFTPRHFNDSGDWLADKDAENHGWAGIQVVDGVIIEQWLEREPAVHIWFSELIGKLPTDVRPLSTWWDRWADATSPRLPRGLILAGRADRAADLRASLRSSAAALTIAADSADEVLAFVAASLSDDEIDSRWSEDAGGPAGSAQGAEHPAADLTDPTPRIEDADPSAGSTLAGSTSVEPLPTRAALLTQAVIVDTANAWARLAQETTPLILIPTFADPDIGIATAAGHHVVVGSNARRPNNNPLPRIRVDDAADALRRAGVEFRRSYEYARSARRSLGALRRRLANSGQFREPEWSTGTTTTMLGPLLLLGAWHESNDADIALVEEITDTKWRRLSRDLQTVTRMQDPPIRVQSKAWEFLDPTDAWHLLADAVTSQDLGNFQSRLVDVVAEHDPVLDLPADEQLLAGIRGIRRKYSNGIRQGMATTIAVLGAVINDQVLQDGLTGQQHATSAVRTLLADDDRDHWIALAPMLPTLAEGAPDAFLEAVERAVAAADEPLLALFDEGSDSVLGHRNSMHHHLLWALENLTFSERHITRALLLLARLAQADPGGRSVSRPTSSIVAALHLMHPQSVVTDESRRDILELLDARYPDVACDVMVRLIEGTAGGTFFSSSTPRWRDWTQSQTARTISQVWADVVDIVGRLSESVRRDPRRAKELVKILPHPSTGERRLLLAAISSAASTLEEPHRRAVAKELAELVKRRRRAGSGAPRSMSEEDVEAIAQAATNLASDIFAVPPTDWFAFWPRPAEEADSHADVDDLIDEGRTKTIQTIYESSGLAGVAEVARTSEAVTILGQYLAQHTDAQDSDVFGLNPSIDDIDGAITQLVIGYAARRFQDRGTDWLAAALASADESTQAVLLRGCPATPELLELVDSRTEAVQEAYWRHPLPAVIPDGSTQHYVRRLLDRDRAWSALVVLIIHARLESQPGSRKFDLELRALEAVRATTENPQGLMDHHVYGLGKLLDQLAAADVDQTRLAQIEYSFIRVLEHARPPTALYAEFARNPHLFSSVVLGSFGRESASDEDTDNEVLDNATGATAGSEGRPAGFDDIDLLDESIARALFGVDGWGLIRGWRGLPGQTSKHEVDMNELTSWVETVLAVLDAHDRRQSGRHQIGEVLASPITDADGTWPCEAVRDLLEQLQDPTIEEGLFIGRFNQRGVTVRSPYDGGEQERTLAEQYQAQADAVRDKWPRTGRLLDQLAKGYAADARQEDLGVDD